MQFIQLSQRFCTLSMGYIRSEKIHRDLPISLVYEEIQMEKK